MLLKAGPILNNYEKVKKKKTEGSEHPNNLFFLFLLLLLFYTNSRYQPLTTLFNEWKVRSEKLILRKTKKRKTKTRKTDLYPNKHKPKVQCVIYRVGKAAGVEFEQ